MVSDTGETVNGMVPETGNGTVSEKEVSCEITKHDTEEQLDSTPVDPDLERLKPGVATGKYEIIMKEKQGFFASAIPEKLPCLIAVLLCFLNCVAPGLGTLVSAPFSLCEKEKPQKKRIRNFFVNLLTAFLQLVTTPLVLIGWLWSIMWAIEYLKPLKGDGFEES